MRAEAIQSEIANRTAVKLYKQSKLKRTSSVFWAFLTYDNGGDLSIGAWTPIVYNMVLPAEFESATFHLGGERSIQLSYGSQLERRHLAGIL
jgi:hypothetical protein